MNNLKKLREDKNLSLRDIAIIAETTHSQLSRVENKKAHLTQKQIITLSTFFNVSTDYLLGLSNISNPKPHQFNYYTDTSSLVTLEDIIKKYNHSDFMIIFNDDFIKLIFNDPGKAEVIYKRVK